MAFRKIKYSFLAHGGCVKNESWLFRIGYSTMFKLINEVCKVLTKILVPRYVRFPNSRRFLQIL